MAERKAFPLRISKELFDEIQRMAAQEFRSVNGQIEYLLRESVRRRGRSHPAPHETEPEPPAPDS